ncbi:hypothetical protein A5892_03790 [Halotalea alkalilenta]|uniref:POTRA domain-containing protein n=1 Tax=Halotalea alkalilenta TaxID=376489 RepID=A0A172YBU9_9GAMM|nr:hypothetical protein A5892_03790 [Halotalea alkalilenta]
MGLSVAVSPRVRGKWGGVLLLLLGTPLCWAQSSTPSDLELQREGQRRLIEDQRQRLDGLQRLRPAPTLREQPSMAVGSGCVTVQRLVVEGGERLPAERLEALRREHLGKCLDAAALNALLASITNDYLDRGFITTRAYLPVQETDEALVVRVVEGRLEGIDRPATLPASSVAMASPLEVGEVLNLRDIEQTLDQLNRLASRRVTAALRPGDRVGGSRVVLEDDPGRPWRIHLSRHNGGQPSVGRQQWGLGLWLDEPLGLADQFDLQLIRSQARGAERNTDSNQVGYSLPYGYWNFAYRYIDSAYATRGEANGFIFDLDGKSERHLLRAERLIARDQTSKTSLSTQLSRTATRNYIDGTRIGVSSRVLSEWRLGLNHGRRLAGGLFNGDVAWSHGTGLFGADDDHGRPDGAPKARYDKANLTLSYLRPFSVVGLPLRYFGLLHAQWSPDVLYSPARLSLGGQDSVRGFSEQSLPGDTGGYWRNQVTWSHPLNPVPRVFDLFEVTLAYDLGVIRHGRYNDELHGRMSGAALEFGLRGEQLSALLGVSRSIERPSALPQRETPIYFELGLTL